MRKKLDYINYNTYCPYCSAKNSIELDYCEHPITHEKFGYKHYCGECGKRLSGKYLGELVEFSDYRNIKLNILTRPFTEMNDMELLHHFQYRNKDYKITTLKEVKEKYYNYKIVSIRVLEMPYIEIYKENKDD